MSLLAPLYALGLLAIAAPILLHLIRRTPRGEVPFSSLMFLSPTPPKMTRRSRLDNWLLLLLRVAALGLLAFAFARPFLRESTRLDATEVGRRRVAILIDTSASLRRGDLWAQSKARATEAIDALGPGDELAILAFDDAPRPLLGFEESATLDPARRRAVALGLIDGLSPTWGSTDLGRALVEALAAIEDVTESSEATGRVPRRIVLIGDLQRGSRLDALGSLEWPADVDLDLRAVADPRPNASPQWLDAATDAGADEAEASLRVRVSNEPGSRQERFKLRWGEGDAVGRPVEVYVPPGESRVVRVDRPSKSSTLRLEGDSQPFDNTLFLADDRSGEEATVVYVGADAAEDPAGSRYYLDRVVADATRRPVRIRGISPAADLAWEPGESVPLVVLTTETTPGNLRKLGEYARGGGTLLVVLGQAGRSEALAALLDVPEVVTEEARVARDAMLGEIAFDHPLFAPLAGPQFNDFTRIHFWKYRRLDPKSLGDARVLARFEDGSPAVVEKARGKGRVVVLASGWTPADSQLARSSKFVPLMASLLSRPGDRPLEAAALRVHAAVTLPAGATAVVKPDRTLVELNAGADTFDGADQPGIYAVETPDGPEAFAVNLDPAEGRTEPLEAEALEQLGVRLASRTVEVVDPARRRQMRNAELEGRQKLWRPLILAALGILIVETWLAGRQARPRAARAEVAS